MSSQKTRKQDLFILGGLAAVGVATVGGYLAWQRYGFGDFQIASTPPGVPVIMDGLAIGNTPVTGRARAGPHSISIPATTTDPTTGQTIPFNQWLDGVMTSDRTIDFLPTGQGDYLGNSFAATYSTSGGGGQIPTVVNLNGPTATTQYLAAKAYMAAKSYACVLYDNLLYSAQGDWTRSDYETSFLANASGVKDSANNLWLIPINQPGIPLAFVATVLDSVGRPVPNVQVAFWWDTPTVTSSSLGFTLYRLSSDVYQEIDLGDFAHPFIRTTDANGNAVLNVLPLLLNNVTGDIVAFLGATYGGSGTETSACLIPLFSQGCGPDVNTRLPFTRNRTNTGFGCPSITDGGFYYCLTRPPVSGDGNGTVYDSTNPIQDQQLALLSAAVVGSPLVRTAGRLTVYTKLAAKSP